MKTSIIYPGIPGPDSDPQTEEESTPELPERERKHGVEAARTGFMAVALMAASMLFAQSTPTTPTTPQTPTNTPTTPHSTTQPAHSNQGWTMFDNSVNTRLKLQGDQLQRLQEVDNRYKERYTGLGNKPWTNSGYASLTEQRNKDIKGILTPEQYKEWSTTYGGTTMQNKTMRKTPSNSGTTTPPTDKP